MCGIVGSLDMRPSPSPIDEAILCRMLWMIRHRGPDSSGIYVDDRVGLGSVRLSVIDLDRGIQPISDESGRRWIVFNGEIFNYIELRERLVAKGHAFRTQTDTEVIVHLYEDMGSSCVEHLNGQFAFALWDQEREELLLARDRLGTRPLYYTIAGGVLVFSSEIKALFADPLVSREIDVVSLDQVFTFWAPLPSHTVFRGVSQVPPAHVLHVKGKERSLQRYWSLEFSRKDSATDNGSEEDYANRLRELLVDAVRLRLRADVPVGAYLSGGLDSAIIAALAKTFTPRDLRTFSVSFEDEAFDETTYQARMNSFLETNHSRLICTNQDIAQAFPNVIWHTEVPLLRTAPVPMFLLSKLVRDSGYKVVLTGEGADEFLAGYDIFKEAKIRAFCAANPASKYRPLLLRRLYPEIRALHSGSQAGLEGFFVRGIEPNRPCASHTVRWRNSSRIRRLYTDDIKKALAANNTQAGQSGIEAILPGEMTDWDVLSRAQYVEATIFLSEYLLSSQGDRVAMAHAVEGRFPFLDHRVVEFCNAIPSRFKLKGLTEKSVLRKSVQDLLPRDVVARRKHPYRAPSRDVFFGSPRLDYVSEMLSDTALKKVGLLDPAAIARLLKKIEKGGPIGENDEMALTGALSLQLLYHHFVIDFNAHVPFDAPGPDRVVRATRWYAIPSTDWRPAPMCMHEVEWPS